MQTFCGPKVDSAFYFLFLQVHRMKNEEEQYMYTRNPASQASMRAHSSYVHRVTSEVAVAFLPEVVAQI